MPHVDMRYFAINHSNSAKSLKTLLHYTRTCIPWKSAMESWFLFMFELLLEAPLLTTVQARLRLTLISPQTKSYDCNNFNSYLFLPKFYVCFSWMRSLEISKIFTAFFSFVHIALLLIQIEQTCFAVSARSLAEIQ